VDQLFSRAYVDDLRFRDVTNITKSALCHNNEVIILELPPTLVRWARRIAVNIDKLPELWRKSDQANTWAEKQNAAARNRALQP